MKNIIYAMCIVFIGTFVSCKNEPKIDYTIISGTIKNIPEGQIRILLKNGEVKSLKINKETFLDTIRIKEGIYTIVYPASQSKIYVSHGSKIILNADGKNYAKSLVYSGDNAEINNYFLNSFNSHIDFFKNGNKNFALEEEVFSNEIDALKNADQNKLKALVDFPESFKEVEQKRIYYAYLYKKLVYNGNHGYYAKKKDFISASTQFVKELQEMSLNDESGYFYSGDYKQLINDKLNNASAELVKNESISQELAKIKTVLNTITNVNIKNDILYEDVSGGLAYVKNKDLYVEEYLKHSSDKENNLKVKKLLKDLALLDPGKPSPDFTNYRDYNGGTKSLNDFKGKYVYIDVWATWCGPCKYELPFLKKVEEKYHDKNIEFVSISVDVERDFNKWKKMIKDDQMKGVQLFADNNFNSSFIKAYKINGIPQFMLLDPKGNIIASNAPRPSSKELIKLFNKQGI